MQSFRSVSVHDDVTTTFSQLMNRYRSSLTRVFISISPGLFVLSGVTWSLKVASLLLSLIQYFRYCNCFMASSNLHCLCYCGNSCNGLLHTQLSFNHFQNPFIMVFLLQVCELGPLSSHTMINIYHDRKHVHCIHRSVTSTTTMFSPFFDDGHVYFPVTCNIHLSQSIGTKKQAQ